MPHGEGYLQFPCRKSITLTCPTNPPHACLSKEPLSQLCKKHQGPLWGLTCNYLLATELVMHNLNTTFFFLDSIIIDTKGTRSPDSAFPRFWTHPLKKRKIVVHTSLERDNTNTNWDILYDIDSLVPNAADKDLRFLILELFFFSQTRDIKRKMLHCILLLCKSLSIHLWLQKLMCEWLGETSFCEMSTLLAFIGCVAPHRHPGALFSSASLSLQVFEFQPRQCRESCLVEGSQVS